MRCAIPRLASTRNWHDERQWKADCLRQGKKVRKHYVHLDYKAYDRKSSQPVFEEPSTETAKTIDKRVDAVMEARGSPWRASMRQWAQKAEAKREKLKKRPRRSRSASPLRRRRFKLPINPPPAAA